MDSEIIDYLKTLCEGLKLNPNPLQDDWKYKNIYDFVVNEGQNFERHIDDPCAGKKREPKQCFQNAFTMLYIDWNESWGDWLYCEGFAYGRGGVIPVHHAWLIDDAGMVVDPTWETQGDEYFGVAFNRQWAKEAVLNKGTYGVVDDWRNKWPLLRGIDTVEWKCEVAANV